jgi:hypothetical protein
LGQVSCFCRPLVSAPVVFSQGKESKIAVVVGTITDDIRLTGHTLPAIKVAALRFTDAARARITQAGGQCLTFDQLALLQPKGANTVLLRARKTARTANKHFGAPGVPGSTVQPKVRSEGRKVSSASPSAFLRSEIVDFFSALLQLALHCMRPVSCSSSVAVAAVQAVASRFKCALCPAALSTSPAGAFRFSAVELVCIWRSVAVTGLRASQETLLTFHGDRRFLWR